MPIKRRVTRQIMIGNVPVGGGAPVSIQSMTTTPTSDVHATLREIRRLEEAGCEIVRLGIPDEDSAKAIAAIARQSRIPLVADIHFDHRLALLSIASGVHALRINPGNIRQKEHVGEIVRACKDRGIPIRIGVNGGSIDRSKYPHPTPEALVDSALSHIRILEDLDFRDIKVSLKSSDVPVMVEAYRQFAKLNDYPLHLGVTEAGPYGQSIVKSSIGIGTLLLDGIGDTVRVSVTGDVALEAEAARNILRTVGLRKEGIEFISCPTCARKEYDVEKTVKVLTDKTKNVKKYMKVAVMGCVVNGPGEACEADLGVAVGKKGAVLFKNGKIIKNLSKKDVIKALLLEIIK